MYQPVSQVEPAHRLSKLLAEDVEVSAFYYNMGNGADSR